MSIVRALLTSDQMAGLVRRLQLQDRLLRRYIEEEVEAAVPLDQAWIDKRCEQLCGDRSREQLLEQNCWSEDDLISHLWCPEALNRFAEQRFGAGAEEEFLRSGADEDQVVYSLLRTRNAGLARELWIRFEEGESSFAELAKTFGEGPEAVHMGVIGPTRIGSLHPPLIAETLRRLQPGELHPPQLIGEWSLLILLERLTPASFNAEMKQRLIARQMDAFLVDRVNRLKTGEKLTPLHYDA